MHGIDEFSKPTTPIAGNGKWYSEMNRYHWFVLVVAALGWLFDCLDQQLFVLARQPAMRELLEPLSDPGEFQARIDAYSGYATTIFLLGWASGGLVFGVMGDRVGRAKTMVLTILLYSLFTGLSSFSQGFWDFALYRFLTGLGVGGEFAVGVALVAEVMPDRARPYTLSLLQALSAIGNVSAAFIGMGFGKLVESGVMQNVWRPMFLVGAIPALLALVIRRRLKEPERWQHVTHVGELSRQLGSYRALFHDRRWRRHALVGLTLAFSGVVGLWAVGFFTMDLVGNVLRSRFLAEAEALGTVSEQAVREIDGRVAQWKGITSLMINLGAFLGMYGFGLITEHLGRKATFALAFLAAAFSTAGVFAYLNEFSEIFWMVPLMGFCQLSLFAGYAIYFPELFPTHLRSTGISFCYNVARFVAAVGPTMLALLTTRVFAHTDEPLRYAGLTMCSVFLVGLFVLPFAPETKGRPLPE